MTPQERQLIDDLFDRLGKLETAPRDAEAMSAIMQGLRSAPNAVYALVQTALVQDEALKRANSRIQELEAGHAPEQNQSGGFLDSMRDAIFGQNQPQGSGPQGSATQGSVPNVRAPGMGGRPVWKQRRRDAADARRRPIWSGAAARLRPARLRSALWRAAAGVRRRRRIVPRNRRGGSGRVVGGRFCSAASAR